MPISICERSCTNCHPQTNRRRSRVSSGSSGHWDNSHHGWTCTRRGGSVEGFRIMARAGKGSHIRLGMPSRRCIDRTSGAGCSP